MTGNGWKAALGIAAASLALGSWMVSPADADGELQAVAPNALPPNAIVVGDGAPTRAELGGVAISARAVPGGYDVLLENPGNAARRVKWELDCQEVSGMAIGRMGPMERRVHHEVIELSVLAHGRAVHRLRFEEPEPNALNEAMFRNASRRLVVRALRNPQAMAMLALPSHG